MDRLIWGAPVDGTSNSSAMLKTEEKNPFAYLSRFVRTS